MIRRRSLFSHFHTIQRRFKGAEEARFYVRDRLGSLVGFAHVFLDDDRPDQDRRQRFAKLCDDAEQEFRRDYGPLMTVVGGPVVGAGR